MEANVPKKIFRGKVPDTATIVVCTPNNPKRKNTRAYWKFELVRKFNGSKVQDYRDAVSAIRANPNGPWAQTYGLSKKQAEISASEGAGLGELRWCLEGSRMFIKLK